MPHRTPLHDWHVAHGGRMVDFAGWDMPIQYTTITEEHQAVRTAAGLFDISHMGRLVFQGPEALNLIQRLYTNDAAAIKPGQIRYGLICNEQGGILDDVLVYHFEQFWLMVVNASNRAKLLTWIDKHRADFRVEVSDQTLAWAMVAVQGPLALRLLEATGDFTEISPLLDGEAYAEAGRLHAVQLDRLRYYQAVACPTPLARPDAVQKIVSRTGYTGEDGFEVILDSAEAASFCDKLLKIAPELGMAILPCGLGARDTLRLEAAMPLYGHELSEEIDPFQAGLGWAVKMDKGDFIGRAALEKRRQDPGRRQRVGLELAGKRLAREGAIVLANGKEIGQVTSGTFAPTLARGVAMAYIDPGSAAVGTALSIDVRGKPEAARVVPLPFYKRPK